MNLSELNKLDVNVVPMTLVREIFAQLKEEVEALRDDRDRIRDDLNATHEWLAVEFPQAFASLKMKVLNPDALLTKDK